MSSEEVAEDYALALQALTLNSRYEISNLTVIAKENTEHALAISEAVKNHIKQTAPQKKLPAFYVLDSVVKNVGTPYTLFFGRQLYSTFMEAYALVDNNVRRKMDEMLKTWKEPVPGSMDTRPVFPPDVTRPIENALIKAKTSFLQAHQEHLRNQPQHLSRSHLVPSPTPYQQVPTPPSAYRPPSQQALTYGPSYPSQQYLQPTSGQQLGSLPMNGQPLVQQYQVAEHNVQSYPPQNPVQQYTSQNNQQYPIQSTYSTPINGGPGFGLPPRPTSTPQYNHPPQNGAIWEKYPSQISQPAEDIVGPLNNDIERLIAESKAAWAQNFQDTSIGTRLKALLDLQSILQNQKLPPDQIALIKNQVAQLSEASKPKPVIQSSPPPPPPPPTVAPAQPPSLDTILGPGALAALLARQHAGSQSIPQPISPSIRSPQLSQAQPEYQPPPAAPPSAAPPVPSASSLLEKLRAAGMLPAPSTGPNNSSTLSSLPGLPSLSFLSTPPISKTPLPGMANDVVLKAASLKMYFCQSLPPDLFVNKHSPRPHLISNLFERLGVPCTQCGRRFHTTEEGKKKKEIHMDWHFRIRQRMEEAESRGQHRSWYVDELDWIRSREIDDESGTVIPDTNNDNAISPKAKKLEYLPVPDDPALANSVCPICQEKFEMKWLDEAQEFVWMDAKMVGGKIYHASCYAEATKDSSAVARRGGGTPEPASILGKRKAEEDFMALRTKIKSEPI